ncbi:MAG: TVP38/TMEM64 family protein [Gammaproteobacteria bacterium]
MTSIILPLSLLESSLQDIVDQITIWSGENIIFNSLLVIFALTADVFFPVPNGLTNTIAGAILGFYIAIPIIWIGLTSGAIVGFAIGKFAAKPIAKKILSESELKKSQDLSKKFGISILLLSRPAPAFAEISTVAAGMSGMSWFTFLSVMIISNFLVAIIYSLIGTAALSSQSVSLAFIGIAIIPFLFWLLARRFF